MSCSVSIDPTTGNEPFDESGYGQLHSPVRKQALNVTLNFEMSGRYFQLLLTFKAYLAVGHHHIQPVKAQRSHAELRVSQSDNMILRKGVHVRNYSN